MTKPKPDATLASEQPFEGEWVYKFPDHDTAWAFMLACDEAGYEAGYPNPTKAGGFTVRVLQETPNV